MTFDFKCSSCGSVTKEDHDNIGMCENQMCPLHGKIVTVKNNVAPIEIKQNGKTIRITIEIL